MGELSNGNCAAVIFLPIAERELRVAARKPGTFWLRIVAALVAVLIGSGFMLMAQLGRFPIPSFGGFLFGTLTWLCLGGALSAGLFFTSDCLSEEKREGTLGFLFLTDLRGYDVVSGKLLATALRCLYPLLAIFPILALTMLMGGVTGAQFWKTLLALLNAMFCSLAVGLLVSAVSHDSQKAMAGTLLLVLLFVGGGPLADGILAAMHRPLGAVGEFFSLSSPWYAFGDASAWGPASSYWTALFVSHLVGWVLLAAACGLVPRIWQDKGNRSRQSRRGWMHFWKYGSARYRLALRRRLLDRNPILWLARRERWQAMGVWMVAILLATPIVLMAFDQDSAGFIWMAVNRLGVPAVCLWTASQAGRFFCESRRSGLMELLLTTPINAEVIVRSQWRALLRVFGPPVGLLVAVQFAGNIHLAGVSPGFAVSVAGSTGGAIPQWLIILLSAGLAMLVTLANLIALSWFGMWMGMTSKNNHIATLKTVAFVGVIPWFVSYFVAGILSFLVMSPFLANAFRKLGSTTTPPAIMNWIPFIFVGLQTFFTLGKDFFFWAWARGQLRSSFRAQAAGGIGSFQFTPHTIPSHPLVAPPVISQPNPVP